MYYYILLHTTTTCYYMLLHATTYYYIRLHTTVWCSAAALETVHHTRGRRQQATAPAQSQRRGAQKHRSGTPTGILSTWHDANTEGGTTPFVTLSTTVRCWVCVARLALKRLSAVWLGGCSGSAASMAAATKALRPGRDAHSGTDGPSSFCKRSQDGDRFKGVERTWRTASGRAEPRSPLPERGVSTWGGAAIC